MSLEQAHQRSLQERPHHPDEPQPTKWTGRRAEAWTGFKRARDEIAHIEHWTVTGRHRKPWGRRAAPWTLATAEADEQARNPWRAAA